MADHMREQILDAIVTELGGLVGVTVTKNKFYPEPPGNLPAIDVQQGLDTLNASPHPFQDHLFDVELVCYAQANDDPLEDVNNLEKDAHVALRGNRKLGLNSNVHDTYWSSTSEPELSDASKKKTARMTATWRVEYRTDIDDSST